MYSGAALFAPSLSGLAACSKSMESGATRDALAGAGGYGPLTVAGAELELPRGFTYTVLGEAGGKMSDGRPIPNSHDGMAAFRMSNGNVRLLRNHENRDTPAESSVKGSASLAYDPRAGGCVTSLEVRLDSNGPPVVVKEFVALSGTIVNCAGGPTPWGSWLTCEESVAGTTQGWSRNHGYVFEVSASAETQVPAQPLTAMGRFVHEAAAVDPSTGIVYETEDLAPGGFYRFIPRTKGVLSAGGVLQMLAIRDSPQYNTAKGQTVGKVLPAFWVTIADPDPANAGEDPSAVHRQGVALGGASFSRLEGCWFGDKSIYFNATNGGEAMCGQVWRYRPTSDNAGELTLVFESPAREVLNSPDNITVSPRGGLLLCEDAGTDQYMRGLTRDGRIFDFAHMIGPSTEVAGACFSPNGRVLFFNIQGSTRDAGAALGMTFAVRGPWGKGAL